MLMGIVQHDKVDDKEGGVEDKVEAAYQDRASLDTKLNTSHATPSNQSPLWPEPCSARVLVSRAWPEQEGREEKT